MTMQFKAGHVTLLCLESSQVRSQSGPALLATQPFGRTLCCWPSFHGQNPRIVMRSRGQH